MSVSIGASAVGARAYTATASQGLLFMVEALYNASGLGLPIVMTVANRAIGAPINIWNDHSDSMSQRDSGWIQLYAETNQEALDLHIQAFRIAEELACPVMVCMDGFILTHAYDRVDIPTQRDVDAFLPRYEPRQMLDTADPASIGAMVGPEAFTEVRYLSHHKQLRALKVIPHLAAEFRDRFGRDSGGLLRPYRTSDAETIVVALGSVNGTVQEVVDAMREQGTIELRTRSGDDKRTVIAEVVDHGDGIRRADLPKIFEPFYTTKAPGRGTGLGLSICYAIVAEHGGRIEVDSTPGEGSVFRIVLPRTDERGDAT